MTRQACITLLRASWLCKHFMEQYRKSLAKASVQGWVEKHLCQHCLLFSNICAYLCLFFSNIWCHLASSCSSVVLSCCSFVLLCTYFFLFIALFFKNLLHGGIGRCLSQHVANMMLRMKREFAGSHTQILPVFDTLLLLDRNVDLLTPVATQLTYEGLIDEIFGITNGKWVLNLCRHNRKT